MSKRFLSLVLALVMVLGTLGTAVFAAGPTGNERVDKLIELGLVKGRDGDYALSESIRRDEVAAMVVRAMNLETVAEAMKYTPTKFKDVKAGEWNNGYVAVAEGEGITKGVSANEFAPARDITYAEVAAMMVRVLGAMTAEEEKTASWPATYIAKAEKLGIFKDVEMTATNAVAKRQQVFEMVFNTISNKAANYLVANTVEGIVVENYRTEGLNKDDIVVHVMSDQVEKSGSKYGKDQEFRVTIDKELKAKGLDVETLLGKVVEVAFDKDDKVVDIKVNNNYQYLQGNLTDVEERQLRLEGKWYTVVKEEGRYSDDERLFQAYFNNEDVHYFDAKDFDSKGKVDVTNPRSFAGKANLSDNEEYARITVRNGKVLFVEAFDFVDIAPVAKDIDSKNVVSYYDDSKDGEINTLTVGAAAYVIEVNEVEGKNEMTLGSNADIKSNDVIHWYRSGNRNELTVFVRPAENNAVEGVYKEASARRAKDAADIMIRVESTDYPAFIGSEDNRNPVYSTLASGQIFYELTGDYDVELRPFEKEEVTLLLDMFGFVQSISSEKVDGSFYGMVSNTSRSKGEVRLVNVENENEWYETDINTVFAGVGGRTKDAQFDEFDKYDLVKATSKDGLLTRLAKTAADFGPKKVEKLSSDVIDFGGKEFFYIGKRTVLFIENSPTGTPVSMSVADFINKYDQKSDIEAYVVESSDAKIADVIVIKKATGKFTPDATIAKVTRVITGRTNDPYAIRVEIPGIEEEKTFNIVGGDNIGKLTRKEIVAGSIVELEHEKVKGWEDDADSVTALTEVLDENDEPIFEVVRVDRDRARNEYYIELKDANNETRTLWVSKYADVFGDYKVGSFVAIGEIDERLETIYLLDVRTHKDGKRITKADGVWANPDQEAADAVIALINALPAVEELKLEDKEAVEAARAAFVALTAEQKDLITATVLQKLVDAETKIAELEAPK